MIVAINPWTFPKLLGSKETKISHTNVYFLTQFVASFELSNLRNARQNIFSKLHQIKGLITTIKMIWFQCPYLNLTVSADRGDKEAH